MSTHPAYPHRPKRSAVFVASMVALVVGGGAILFTALWLVVNGSTDSGRGAAEDMCEKFVSDRLKSPGTADFPGASSVAQLAGGEYRVTGAVDSQNGFGALLRTDYVCTVRDMGGDRWRLVNLDLDDE